jgi:hypothetical protein
MRSRHNGERSVKAIASTEMLQDVATRYAKCKKSKFFLQKRLGDCLDRRSG